MTEKTLRIARALDQLMRDDPRLSGWFSLESEDEHLGRITRLGIFVEPAALSEIEQIVLGKESADDDTGGYIFAIGYEYGISRLGSPSSGEAHQSVIAGRVSASFVYRHEDSSLTIQVSAQATKACVRSLEHIRDAVLRDPRTARKMSRAHPPKIVWRFDDAAYLERIERCRTELFDRPEGVLCLTNRADVVATERIDPLRVYESLLSTDASSVTNVAPHSGIIVQRCPDGTEVAFVTSSPESFLRVQHGKITSSPMKGTRPRGATENEDGALADDLAQSVKEIRENTAVTRAICEELSNVCVPETVHVTADCEVRTFDRVHQMVSDIEGQLVSGTTLKEVLDVTFPGTSMTGVPKHESMIFLAKLEGAERGLYSGCYGWISHDGEADLAMAIRCAEIKDNVAAVGAGGGITRESNPNEELAEVKLKARAVLSALGERYP